MHPTLQLKHYSFMLFSSRCNPFSVLLLFLFQGVLMQLRPSKVRGHLLWPLAFWVSPSDFTAEPTTTLAILQKQGDSTAHEMLRPYHVPRSTGSDRDGAPRPQPSNLQPLHTHDFTHTQQSHPPTVWSTLFPRHEQNRAARVSVGVESSYFGIAIWEL